MSLPQNCAIGLLRDLSQNGSGNGSFAVQPSTNGWSPISAFFLPSIVILENIMATIPNQGGQTRTDSDVTHCNNTLQHKNAAGTLLGSWIEIPNDSGLRVECRYCKKFYGNILLSADAQKAYAEQQRRLSCPGCGESPFAG